MSALACDAARELLVARLEAPLGADDARRLADHLAVCADCAAEAAAMQATWEDLAALPSPAAPAPRLRAELRDAVAAEQARLDRFAGRFAGDGAHDGRDDRERGAALHGFDLARRPFLSQLAAAVVLVAAGAALGAFVTRERAREDVAALRGEVHTLTSTVALTMLRQDAAGERLVGVRYGGEAADDAEVTAALLDAVRRDPSVSVRLAALDALGRMASRPEVQERLLADLPAQPSPMAQVAIAELLATRGTPPVRSALARLAEGEALDPAIRDHVKKVLSHAT